MTKTRFTGAALIAALTLAACDPAATPSSSKPASRAATPLPVPEWFPDPVTMGDQAILEATVRAQHSAAPTELLKDKCGREFPDVNHMKISNGASIRAYRDHKEKLPGITKCWVKSAPEVLENRAVQIDYLYTLADQLEARPDRSDTLNSAIRYMRLIKLDREIEQVQGKILTIANNGPALDDGIRRFRGYQKKERQSWARAAAKASAEWTAQNQDFFTRPGPGLGQIGGFRRTSTMIPNASPQLKVAMDAMDQAMIGPDAYMQALARDLAAFGTPPAAGGGAGGSSITLTESQYCSYGRDQAGNCVSYDDLLADAEARDAARRAQDLERLAQQRAAARDLAAKRAAEAAPVVPGATARQM